jgi:hypothetical protein
VNLCALWTFHRQISRLMRRLRNRYFSSLQLLFSFFG